jgi:hypothetical protein
MIKNFQNLSEKTKYVIVFLIIVFLPFLFLISQGKVIFWGTASLQFIPWNQFLFDSVLNGVFPLWNPYNGMGVPFIANLQSAVFYPLNWILFPFYVLFGIKGLTLGITLLIPTHLFIGGIGIMKILGYFERSKFSQFLSAIIFVFSGYILTRLSFISMVWAFAWVPWAVFACMQLKPINENGSYKQIFKLSILIALQILAGHAQTTFYTILVSAIIVIFLKFGSIKNQLFKIISFIASIVLSFMISAVQIIPTIEFLQNSQRSSEVGYEFAANLSLWPARLITVLFGNFWGNPNSGRFLSGGNFWEENIYLGVFPIAILIILFWTYIRKNRKAQISKQSRIIIKIYFALVIFSVLFAFGRFFVLFPFLYEYIPFFSLFQAPSRFLIVYVLSMSILFGFGIDLWISSAFNHKKTIIFLVVFGTFFFMAIAGKIMNPSFPATMINSLLLGSFLGLSFGLITLIKDKIQINQVGLKILVSLVIISDLFFHNFLWETFQPNTIFNDFNQDFVEDEYSRIFLNDQDESFLKFSLFFRPDRLQPLVDLRTTSPTFIPNTNLLNNRFSMVNNFDPIQTEKYTHFWKWINQLSIDEQKKIVSMFGVDKIIHVDPSLLNNILLKEIQSEGIVQWYECGNYVIVEDQLDWLLYYGSKDRQDRCVLLNEELSEFLITKDSNEIPEIQYDFFNVNTININYSSSNPGWLVIRQNWYPGWKAVLDGESEINIKEVDFLFQGFEIPSGDHRIVMSYAPKSFAVGLLISVLTLAFLLIFVIIVQFVENAGKKR